MGFGEGSCAHVSAAVVTIKTSVNANLFSIVDFLRAEAESNLRCATSKFPIANLKQLWGLYVEQKKDKLR